MSNSTRPGGYDESLVVPLEASRRGAHRARVNPLVAALPLLAVVVVVAAVIGVAYTLFLKPSNTADTGTQSLPTVSPAAPTTSTPPGAASSPSGTATPSAGSSPSSGAAATIDKSVAFKVYNGSIAQTVGLGRRATAALQARGWTGASVISGPPPTAAGLSRTTHVYFNRVSQQATAEAIQKALRVGVIKQSASVAMQGIVVVVGDDYRA